MNGPPVVLMLAVIGLLIFFAGRAVSKSMDEDWRRIERANEERRRARAEWERRQHPSGQK